MTRQPNISILYVDDEEINLLLFERFFGERYQVYTAGSGREGLQMLEQHDGEIDVTISDMRMPEMTGVEFIEHANSKYPKIAYFILTGFAFGEEIEEAIRSKMIHQSFSKPLDVKQIESAISEAIP